MKILDIPQSGKRGQTVSQTSPFGQCSRALAITVNPRTPAQQASRDILGQVSRRWRTLTDPQRLAWCAAAKAVLSTPRLGQSGPLSGHQFFKKINCTLARFGQAQVDVPPARPQFPELALTGLVITNTGVVRLKLTCPGQPGALILVRASAPLSPGRSTSRHDVRVLGLCPAPAQGEADITALYTARFGVPLAGTRLFVQVQQLIDGWKDLPSEFSAIVPEAAWPQ